MRELEGQVALISGASGGIGTAIRLVQLAEMGQYAASKHL